MTSPSFGATGGKSFSYACPAPYFITKVEGRSGTYMNGLQIQCSNGSKSPYYGGGTSTMWAETAPKGFNGAVVRAGAFVDAISLKRLPGTGIVAQTPSYGGKGGKEITWAGCPAGQVIGSISGGADKNLNNIKFVCIDPTKKPATAVVAVVPTVPVATSTVSESEFSMSYLWMFIFLVVVCIISVGSWYYMKSSKVSTYPSV